MKKKYPNSKSVTCSTCGAGIGEPCEMGGSYPTTHESRRRKWRRARDQHLQEPPRT